MTDIEALNGVWDLKKSGTLSPDLNQRWDEINQAANDAYQQLYEEAKRRQRGWFKKIGLPPESQKLLNDYPVDMVNGLRHALQPFTASDQALTNLAQQYLGWMQQLLDLSYRITHHVPAQSLGGGHASVPSGGASGTFSNGAISTPAQVAGDPGRSGSHSRGKTQPPGALVVREVHPYILLPPKYASAQSPAGLQASLDRDTEMLTNKMAQAEAALAEARTSIEGMRQQIAGEVPKLVTRQDFDALNGVFHQAEKGRREVRFQLITRIVEVITRLERQYGSSLSHETSGQVDEPTSKFERAVDSTVGDLEKILLDEFGLERIRIQPGMAFDGRYMTKDRDEEPAPSLQLTGKIASVIEPGYWVALPEDDREVYQMAKVRLFSPFKGKR